MLSVVPKNPNYHLNSNPIKQLCAAIVIYSMVVPVTIAYAWTIIYQRVFFTINGIPFVPREPFFNFDRGRLDKLSAWQKFNCQYCAYVNGAVTWARAVANQTELYTCAIKHQTPPKEHEHQAEFLPYERFR